MGDFLWSLSARHGSMMHSPIEVKMPPYQHYDFGTLNALTSYFKEFATAGSNR
jgi:hypothetical protein